MEKKKEIIKLNLSLEKDFYQLLEKKASHDFVRISTWVKQYLMKSLLQNKNNNEKKSKNINNENR